jgi:calcium-independent phospholipase A2
MAGFLRSFTNVVSGLVKSAFSSNPYEVQELSSQQLAKVTVMMKDECLTLYKDGTYYFAVLHRPESSTKYFCIFRLPTENEGMTTFATYNSKLQSLYMTSKRLFSVEMLQKACDTLREHPSWSSSHIAAKLGLNECFRSNTLNKSIEAVCDVTQALPIHIAIESGHMECIQELLVCGVKLDLADRSGDNVFHYAAKSDNANNIQMLASKDPSSVNQLNLYGESALHTACLNDKPDNVEQLLRWNADPTLTMSDRHPIHCAMKVASSRCVEVLCRWKKAQLHLQDSRYGGTPLHWSKNRECIFLLADLGCNFEATNTDGETALHVMIRRNRLPCVMALMSRGSQAKAICNRGNSLHLAVEVCKQCVMWLDHIQFC